MTPSPFKARIVKSGLSQITVAERLGVKRDYLNTRLNGNWPISPELAERLEKILRVYNV